MNISKVVDKLNNLLKSFKKECISASFYNGQSIVCSSDIVKNTIPFGKVAILYFKKEYEKNGKNFATMIKGNGNPVTHVVLPDDFSNSLENFSHLFNLAEDIRMVIATDSKLFPLAKYFAYVRNIPCLLIVSDLNVYNLLSPHISLTSKKASQSINVKCEIHVVIDYDAILLNPHTFADAYAFIVSHALALTDYRIHLGMMGKTPDKTIFALAINAITQTYPLYSFDKQVRGLVLLNNLMSLEIASACSQGEIYKNFSGAVASQIMGEDANEQGKNRLLTSIIIAKLYNLFLSGNYDKILQSPDYLSRVDYICSKLTLDRIGVNEQLINQYETIVSNAKKLSKIKAKTQIDVNSFIECSSKMLSIFSALGGSTEIDKVKRDLSIKHSGDLYLNCMSLVRESGITESI